MRRARIKGVMNLPFRRPDGNKGKEKKTLENEKKIETISPSLNEENQGKAALQNEFIPKTITAETPNIVSQEKKSDSSNQNEVLNKTKVSEEVGGFQNPKTNLPNLRSSPLKNPVDNLSLISPLSVHNNQNVAVKVKKGDEGKAVENEIIPETITTETSNIVSKDKALNNSDHKEIDEDKCKSSEEKSNSKKIQPSMRRFQKAKPNLQDRRSSSIKIPATNLSTDSSSPVQNVINSSKEVNEDKADQEEIIPKGVFTEETLNTVSLESEKRLETRSPSLNEEHESKDLQNVIISETTKETPNIVSEEKNTDCAHQKEIVEDICKSSEEKSNSKTIKLPARRFQKAKPNLPNRRAISIKIPATNLSTDSSSPVQNIINSSKEVNEDKADQEEIIPKGIFTEETLNTVSLESEKRLETRSPSLNEEHESKDLQNEIISETNTKETPNIVSEEKNTCNKNTDCAHQKEIVEDKCKSSEEKSNSKKIRPPVRRFQKAKPNLQDRRSSSINKNSEVKTVQNEIIPQTSTTEKSNNLSEDEKSDSSDQKEIVKDENNISDVETKSKVIKSPVRRLQKPKPNLLDRRSISHKNSATNLSLLTPLSTHDNQSVLHSPEKDENKTTIIDGKTNKNLLSPRPSTKVSSPQSNTGSPNEKSALRERPSATTQQNSSQASSLSKKSRNSQKSANIQRGHREYLNKFKNGIPDRKKLTMFDLIYYNPSNNPLSENQEPPKNGNQFLPITIDEEIIDDPDSTDQAPVPKVKVGPDGQIILDEKSLVIETTGTKKARLELANCEAIVDDGPCNYGIYRRKMSRGWTKQETLKFYKALNTIGTDFLLMQTLFPDRTRQELKMKFKKEDKIHRSLIEKTLRNPIDFNLEELEREAEMEKAMKENPPQEKEPKPKPTRKRTGHHQSRYSKVCEESIITPEKKKKKVTRKRKRKKIVESDEDDELYQEYIDDLTLKNINYNPLNKTCDEKDISPSEIQEEENLNEQTNESESKDEEVEKEELNELEFLSRAPRPTRSGRVPQSRITNDHIDTLRESEKVEKELPVAVNEPTLPHMPKVNPGTMLLFSTPSQEDPNSMVYQLFMVGPSTSSSESTNVIGSGPPLEMSSSSSIIPEDTSTIVVDCGETLADSLSEPVTDVLQDKATDAIGSSNGQTSSSSHILQ